MQFKFSKRGLLFVVSITGIVFSSVLILLVTFNIEAQFSSTNTVSSLPIELPVLDVVQTGAITQTVQKIILFTGQSIGLPVRLKISKIIIDAPIKSVGLTTNGAMDVTKGPYDVAWYNIGPRPGESGSAVIAGHYGVWKNGAISVFNKLNTLSKGDKVSIEDDKGIIISFVVRESKIYTSDADASDVFYSNDGKSHLNLVTCIQDKVTKKYPNRLVVFTDKEE